MMNNPLNYLSSILLLTAFVVNIQAQVNPQKMANPPKPLTDEAFNNHLTAEMDYPSPHLMDDSIVINLLYAKEKSLQDLLESVRQTKGKSKHHSAFCRMAVMLVDDDLTITFEDIDDKRFYEDAKGIKDTYSYFYWSEKKGKMMGWVICDNAHFVIYNFGVPENYIMKYIDTYDHLKMTWRPYQWPDEWLGKKIYRVHSCWQQSFVLQNGIFVECDLKGIKIPNN